MLTQFFKPSIMKNRAARSAVRSARALKTFFGAIPNRTLLDLNGHRSHLLWMEEILGVCFLHQSVGDELVWAIPPGAGVSGAGLSRSQRWLIVSTSLAP